MSFLRKKKESLKHAPESPAMFDKESLRVVKKRRYKRRNRMVALTPLKRDEDNAKIKALLKDAQKVRLRAAVPTLLEQIERDVSADPAKHWAIRSENGLDNETLKQSLKRLDAKLPAGHHEVLCGGRAPMDVAGDILKLLGLPAP